MKIYRKIWEETYGSIPIDEHGRTFEIHHKNGNHNDNNLENLQCVSIDEHLDIHIKQEDWLAVASIARRMQVSPDEQKRLNSLAGKEAYLKKKGWFANDHIETARRGGLANKGLVWYNNGIRSSKFREDPGIGWMLGRTPDHNCGMPHGTILGVFWNNGISNQRSIECPGDGWVRGRFLTEMQRERRKEISRNQSKKTKAS